MAMALFDKTWLQAAALCRPNRNGVRSNERERSVQNNMAMLRSLVAAAAAAFNADATFAAARRVASPRAMMRRVNARFCARVFTSIACAAGVRAFSSFFDGDRRRRRRCTSDRVRARSPFAQSAAARLRRAARLCCVCGGGGARRAGKRASGTLERASGWQRRWRRQRRRRRE